MKLKIGMKVMVKPWGYKTNISEKESLSGNILTIDKVWSNLAGEHSCTVNENTFNWGEDQVEEITLFTKKQREIKINAIIKEIKKNKEYSNCFEDIQKEVTSWDDFKLSNWN